jgi:hypothetical protein
VTAITLDENAWQVPQLIATPEISPISDLGLDSPTLEHYPHMKSHNWNEETPLKSTNIVVNKPAATIEDKAGPTPTAPLKIDDIHKSEDMDDIPVSESATSIKPACESSGLRPPFLPCDKESVENMEKTLGLSAKQAAIDETVQAHVPRAPVADVRTPFVLQTKVKKTQVLDSIPNETQKMPRDIQEAKENTASADLCNSANENNKTKVKSHSILPVRVVSNTVKEPLKTRNHIQTVPTRDQIQIGSTMVDIIKGTNRGKRGVAVGWVNISTLQVKVIKDSSCIVNVRLSSVVIVASQQTPAAARQETDTTTTASQESLSTGIHRVQIMTGTHKLKTGRLVKLKNQNTCLVELDNALGTVNMRLSNLRDMTKENKVDTSRNQVFPKASILASSSNTKCDFVRITAGKHKGSRGRLVGKNGSSTYDVEINTGHRIATVTVRKSSLADLGEF